nr:enkurin-like [Anolis sagrei ordinatus]
MGIPKLQVPTPKDFLRKHSKTPALPKRRRAPGSKRPAEARVPKRTEPPVMGIQSRKDYISTNVAEAIMAVAKKPLRACVDVRKGDKFLIENSGLVIKYRNKKDFGATPKYIRKWKMEAQMAQEEREAYVRESIRKHGLTQLSKEEREKVIEGLKTNWEEVNKEFQALSVVIDSVSRKLRKEKMELEMKQLEEDIKVLEKHKIIYIKNE